MGKKDEEMVAKPELGFKSDSSTGTGSTSNGPARPNWTEWADNSYVPKVRQSDANGLAVYTRSKRNKIRGDGGTGFRDKLRSNADVVVSSNGEFVTHSGNASNVGGVEGNLGTSGFRNAVGASQPEVMEHEVNDDGMVALGARSELQDSVALGTGGLNTDKVTMLNSQKTKMCEKILVKGQPTTVRELGDTFFCMHYICCLVIHSEVDAECVKSGYVSLKITIPITLLYDLPLCFLAFNSFMKNEHFMHLQEYMKQYENVLDNMVLSFICAFFKDHDH